MGGLCTCCRRQVPKDQNSSIKYHGSILRRKTSISAAFSFETKSNLNNGNRCSGTELLATIPSTLDINTATEEDLMTLPTIGRSIARSIVSYRKQIGRFRVVEDLALVNGIGATKLEKFRKEIHVSNSSGSLRQSLRGNNVTNMLININTATFEELCSVKEISEVTAVKILTYRTEKGNFHHINDLVEPAAIIDTPLLLKIKPFLTIDETKYKGKHSRNASSASSKIRSSSYSNFTAFGPESIESNRARVEPYSSTKFGRPVVRIATWNLQQCSVEKVRNPGVREVVCATILENGIKILAVQELVDQDALRYIIDELNSPSLPNIQRLKSTSSMWHCCVLSTIRRKTCEGFEYSGFIWDTSVDIELCDSFLLEKSLQGEVFERSSLLGVFKVKNLEIAVACVHIDDALHTAATQDKGPINLSILGNAISKEISDVKIVVVLGDFNVGTSLESKEGEQHDGFTAIVPQSLPTNISTKNMKGTKCCDNIWLSTSAYKLFTTNYQVVRSGLTNPWIPDGWSWGGVASNHCPVWAEFFID